MELAYKTTGAGKPLIILHGLFGSGENWITVSKAFADMGYQVFMPDQRNHGRSPHSPDFNYTLLAQDLKAFIDQHQLHKPILIGHSMGGKTAMKFASLYPDMLEKLVVVDIAPRYYPPHHGDILRGLYAVDPPTLTSRAEADARLAEHVPELGVRQFLLKNIYRTEAGDFEWRINLPVLSKLIENIGEPLPDSTHISLPTLFLRGERSDYIQPADEAPIRAIFADVQIETIAHAGHWVQAEQPQLFVEAVKRFIG